MAFLGSSTPLSSTSVQSYDSALKGALAAGWQMVSEGPSGAQLKKPKRMRTLDKVCLAAGVGVGAFVHILAGAFLVAIAVIDFALLTKEQTAFLSRESPTEIK